MGYAYPSTDPGSRRKRFWEGYALLLAGLPDRIQLAGAMDANTYTDGHVQVLDDGADPPGRSARCATVQR